MKVNAYVSRETLRARQATEHRCKLLSVMEQVAGTVEDLNGASPEWFHWQDAERLGEMGVVNLPTSGSVYAAWSNGPSAGRSEAWDRVEVVCLDPNVFHVTQRGDNPIRWMDKDHLVKFLIEFTKGWKK